MSGASGLALSIRNAEESETFDLGGQNVSTITNTIQSAFAEPLPVKEMIRITFVTGAGKQARQKYDEGAARAVTSALRDLGFEEDRAASCVMECAGTYKMQHDTAKNLKTIVVFPNIQVTDGGGEGGGEAGASTKQSLIPEGCPAHQIAMSSASVFERMLRSKCPSWSQKKGCQAALERVKGMVDELDEKLMHGTPLDEAEQEFYDTVTGLDDKLSHVKEEIHKQVESGALTKFEKETILELNAERLATLTEEIKDAKGKKREKLEALKAHVQERKALLQDIDPKPPQKLKHEIEIARLWKEAVPLMQMEEKSKGRLLSVKETQAMARKDEIMEEIEALEDASRGWFENDDAFDARVKAIRETFTAKMNQKPKAKKGNGSYAGAVSSNAASNERNTKWMTPGQKQEKNAWGATSAKKKKKAKGSGVFAAMMEKDNDSDSDGADDDHDDDADDSEEEEDEVTTTSSPKKALSPEKKANASKDSNNPQTNNGTSSGKKKNKKNKKKSKGGKKKKDEADMSDDELLATTAAANVAAEKAKEEDVVPSHPVVAFFKDYLIPFILAFIAFIVSLIFGKPKQKQKQK